MMMVMKMMTISIIRNQHPASDDDGVDYDDDDDDKNDVDNVTSIASVSRDTVDVDEQLGNGEVAVIMSTLEIR